MKFIDRYDEEQFERFTSQILKMFVAAKRRSSSLDRVKPQHTMLNSVIVESLNSNPFAQIPCS